MRGKLSSALRRLFLRKAEAVFTDPETRARLAGEGIHIGEARELTAEERAALLEGDEDSEPTVTVICYLADTPVPDRGEIEDPLSAYVEEAGIGRWVGSGQGSLGDRDFFDVTFAVTDLATAVPLLQARLKELGVGASTELSCSDGRIIRVG